MNFRNIRSIRTTLLALFAIFVVAACEDEEKAPIVTFDSAGKGAYIKFVDSEGELFAYVVFKTCFLQAFRKLLANRKYLHRFG